MKFSNALKLNAVDEWRPYYINYAGLKRYVYKNVDLQVGVARGDPSLYTHPSAQSWSVRPSLTGGTPPNERADMEQGTWPTFTPPLSPGSPRQSDLVAPLLGAYGPDSDVRVVLRC